MRCIVIVGFALLAQGAAAEPSATAPGRSRLPGADALDKFQDQDATSAILQRYFPNRQGTVALTDESYAVYAAAALDDPEKFAFAAVPKLMDELDRAGDYQSQQLISRVRRSSGLRERLSEVRKELATLSFTAPADSATLEYVGGQFLLVLYLQADPIVSEDEKLWAGTIGRLTEDGGVTAARWSRFRCNGKKYDFGAQDWRCYVALSQLPPPLMETIESDLGTTVHARWRWKGLARPARSGPRHGQSLRPNVFTIPEALQLELVDQRGAVLYALK